MSLMWAARIASVEPNSARNSRELDAGAAGDFGEADLLEGMFGEQRHQRVDGLVAVGCCRAAAAATGALALHVSACGPWRPPAGCSVCT